MPDSLRADSVLSQLDLDEKVALLSGVDLWSLPGLDRLGLGRLRVTDGPNGARGGGALTGGVKSAAFPVGIALGATWDPGLAREVGTALAREVRDKGAHVLLGPTVNLQRGALNGRNFECYSEDPILTAEIAAAYIAGLQSGGVAATVKHLVANESEVQRTTMSSDVDERTLRELYLLPFEAAVRSGRTWAVMTSYNRLNGTYTSEHDWLLRDVLRGDWGFDGVVMSDWFGSHSMAPTLAAGLDLEMPGPPRDRGAALAAAVRDGTVPEAQVDAAALNLLRLMERTGALSDTAPHREEARDRATTRALIRRAGAAGAVLLKNDRDTLPLAPRARLALIGPNARTARCMGGGSAQLNAHREVSPWEGLEEALGDAALRYAPGCTNHRFEPVLKGPLRAEWFDNEDLAGAPVHVDEMAEAAQFFMGDFAGGRVDPAHFSLRLTGTYTPDVPGRHSVGLHCAGRARVLIDGREVVEAWDGWTPGTTFFEEGCDPRVAPVTLERGTAHAVTIEFRTAPPRHLGLSALHVGIGRPLGVEAIEAAVALARGADVAVLFVGRNGEWDSEGADLPDMVLPGRQDALVSAVAAVARRTVVVLQTGGPVEMPWAGEVDAILQAWYPGQEAGHAIADVLTGKAEPGGRLPQSFPVRLADTPTMGQGDDVYPGAEGHVRYAEGLHIGYRHHARSGVAPLFPFGHGLGYSRIGITGIDVDATAFESEGRVSVTVRLANTGARAGSQVAQLYVAPIDAPVGRPEAELKAFGRLSLAPGRSGELRFDLGARDFAFYDTDGACWTVAPGAFELRVGLSSADTPHRETVERTGALSLPR